MASRPSHRPSSGEPAENDHLSRALSGARLVPEQYRDSDQFLDVVQWNLEWFGASKSRARDEQRYQLIFEILEAINADLFVFQEVVGRSPSSPGSLDAIAASLTSEGAGDYRIEYGAAGGEQRVAMMWDRDTVRAKILPEDLFPRGTHRTGDGKDAFATRAPLFAYFAVREDAIEPRGGIRTFDFQILGVHLKAMAEGHAQRLRSAEVLSQWLVEESPRTDSDAVILGDWNAPPDDPCWKPFHDLEDSREGAVRFRSINDPSDYSYLWLRNRTDKFLSRIDLTAMTLSSFRQVEGEAAQVVRWKPIEEILARAGGWKSAEAVRLLKEIKEKVSDHLPVISRFYWVSREDNP